MEKTPMKWLEWRFKRLAMHGNPAVLLLLGMTGALLLIWLVGIPDLQKQLSQSRVLAASKSRLENMPQRPAQDVVLRQEIETFDQMFPQASQLPESLEKMFAIVESNGLMVDKGEYSLSERPGKILRRFEAEFPVEGSYLQVRRVLHELQKELPAMGIEEISLQREKIGEGKVTAQFHLVFFVRRPS
jgi:hypothetical protein